MAERKRIEGNIAFNKRQYSEAYKIYTTGLEVQKHDITLHSNAAMSSLKMKSYMTTIEHCDKVCFF